MRTYTYSISACEVAERRHVQGRRDGASLGRAIAVLRQEQVGFPGSRAVAMKRLASPGQSQRFLFAFGSIRQHFRPRRHLISAPEWRTEMTNRFAVWNQIITAAAA